VLSDQGSLFQVPAEFSRVNFVGTLARVILCCTGPLVDVHPTVIGWLGLVITALNLMLAVMEVGLFRQFTDAKQLGGRRWRRNRAGDRVFGLALYWAIVIVFLQRDLVLA